MRHVYCAQAHIRRTHVRAPSPIPGDLRDFRKRHRLTQADAARLAISGLRTWAAWEGGDHAMHPAIWRYVQLAARARARRIAQSGGSRAAYFRALVASWG